MTVVLQPMKIDLGLTDLQVGAINSAFFAGIFIFCMPIAHFVDVWSRKKMISLMAFAWSFFTLATGFCSGFISMLFARLGVGVGESGFSSGGTALISASYPPEQRAQKLGIFNMFITIGNYCGYCFWGVFICSSWRLEDTFLRFWCSRHHSGYTCSFYAGLQPEKRWMVQMSSMNHSLKI